MTQAERLVTVGGSMKQMTAALDSQTRLNATLAQQSLQAANAVTEEAVQLASLMQMFRRGQGSAGQPSGTRRAA